MTSTHTNRQTRALKMASYLLAAVLTPACAATPKAVDLIVYGDYLLTMSDGSPVIKNGAVAVTGNQIQAVGTRADIDKNFRAKNTLPGKNRIVMPGLINGHTHSSMTLFRGMADDLELMTWLNQYIFPMEGQFVSPEFIKVGSELACWEMIRGGTTTFVDMYFYPDTIADVAERCGLRAVIASPSIDYPSPGFKGWDDSFQAAVKFVADWQGKNERIIPGFGPHAPYTVSPEHIAQIAQQAIKMNAPVSMHLAESPAETAIVKERYQTTSVTLVDKQGLTNTTLIGAHMVHPTRDEYALLRDKQVGAIHNPTSNLKLASGISPVSEMLKAGVQVGLGTDGAASNNDLDLWEEMRLAALVQKNFTGDPTAVPALAALKMATSMGAAAIGLGEITGQLKPGMRADMIQVSFDSPQLAPVYNVISHLVYAIDSSDVTTTIVSGKILMKDKQVLTLDGTKVKQAADAMAARISAALSDQ